MLIDENFATGHNLIGQRGDALIGYEQEKHAVKNSEKMGLFQRRHDMRTWTGTR